MGKFRNYVIGIGTALAAGAAAASLSWFLDSAEPTVIKRYTENGNQVTLLDYDGNPETVEERVTEGRFSAYGSDAPEGGRTDKREFEPSVERNGRKVNTEVRFYNGSGKKIGEVWSLEPRESLDEKETLPEELSQKQDSEDARYAKLAQRLCRYVVNTGGFVYQIGENLIGAVGDRLSFIETGLDCQEDGKGFIVKPFYDGGIVGLVPFKFNSSAAWTGTDSLQLVKIDSSVDQSEKRVFNDMNLDGKIDEVESASSPSNWETTPESKTREYRSFLKILVRDFGLEDE